MKPTPVRSVLALVAVLALTLGGGCAGYRLGPTAGFPAGARSIEVTAFKNATPEPRLVSALNNALRHQLQQDGSYRLETRGVGDVRITGEITKFQRTAIGFNPGDVLTAQDFSITLTAQVRATESATGRVLLDREISGRTTLRIGTDLASAERQAVPLLATDLARNVTSYLTSGDW
jgi:hypothetical protein